MNTASQDLRAGHNRSISDARQSIILTDNDSIWLSYSDQKDEEVITVTNEKKNDETKTQMYLGSGFDDASVSTYCIRLVQTMFTTSQRGSGGHSAGAETVWSGDHGTGAGSDDGTGARS